MYRTREKRKERLKHIVRAYGRTSSASDSSSDSVCVASDQRLEGRCDVVQCSIRFLRDRYNLSVRVSVKVRVSVNVRVSVRVRIYWRISVTRCCMFDSSNLAGRVPSKGRERRRRGWCVSAVPYLIELYFSLRCEDDEQCSLISGFGLCFEHTRGLKER